METLFAWMAYAVIGLGIGSLARLLMPGDQSGRVIGTALVGLGGAWLGGLLATSMGYGSFSAPSVSSFAFALIGAIFFLATIRFFRS